MCNVLGVYVYSDSIVQYSVDYTILDLVYYTAQ